MNYDLWHESHREDDDTEGAWHVYARAQLRNTDVDDCLVLEIGCGRGGFSQYVVKNYERVKTLYACDYSEQAIAICRRRYEHLSKITWQLEDIQNLTFESASINTIISCETIEHVPDPMKALDELYRVLKPGGKLILTCPNYFNLFGIYCLYRKLIGKPYTEGGQPYVNYILAPIIYRKLLSIGFHIEEFHSSELVIPARVPKTLYSTKTPTWLTFFGSRTFYTLKK